MKGRYLEVTYRKGKPLAAYLYLPRRDGDTVARSEPAAAEMVVDYTADGRAIGVELLAPVTMRLDQLNHVLSGLGVDDLTPQDASPLLAAV
ncbi:MAG: DUF2283 domain-containing protein [Planctomycetota bacterium]